MDPSRKRKIRLIVALTTAVLLAGGLMYTSFSADVPTQTPSQLLAAKSQRHVKMTGKVVDGSIKHQGDQLLFRVRDRDGTKSVPVTYTGEVPDPFRDGREISVNGKLENGTFVSERGSLVTKCPSKFQNAKSNNPAGDSGT